jgi:hypothetical protein
MAANSHILKALTPELRAQEERRRAEIERRRP